MPELKIVAARLAVLTAADFPWFNKDKDMTPPDNGQELFGPPTFSAAKSR
jgi:hypothetical protein